MLNSGQMISFNLKKEPTRKKIGSKRISDMTKDVRKVLSQENQGIIVMVRN